MDATTLYPHNKKAVEAVKKAFLEGNKRAAIVHATGTGKSYCIAAVADDYKDVLVVAPNNFVLDETRKVCHEGCDFRTYASVMYNEGDKDKYDLIVLDEFHRSGAEKWEIGVRKLLEANPNACIFGTSATNIRYLDGARNMADELFDGNVVSFLPLKQAIAEGILPNPTYVSSIYTISETVASRKKRYKNASKKGLDYDGVCRKLDGIAHNWENAGGISSVIRKYITHDMQRIIVFCSKVKRASEARKVLGKWFGMAGFGKVRYYNIDYKEKRLEREMEDFQAPMGEYDLKVAISVNMLNEGVHVPHVDGIIMMRSTISRIIIEQQVGRCLTSNNTGITPVVLDLVNNMDSIRYDEMFGFGDITGENPEGKAHKYSGFPFKVIDECRDIRILLEKLDEEFSRGWTKEECMEIAKKFTKKMDWYKHSTSSYCYAYKHGWLDECCSHMEVLTHIYTKEECLAEARKYNTRNEFWKGAPTIAAACKRLGFWEEATRHMITLFETWTYEKCLAEAKECKTITEFRKHHEKADSVARHNGWYDGIVKDAGLQRTRKSWTDEELIELAKGYERFCDFIRDYPAQGQYVRNKKKIDMLGLSVRRVKWFEKELIELCLGYTDYTLFCKENTGAYYAINKMGLQDKCFAHMNRRKRDEEWTKEECAEKAKECRNRKEFSRKYSYLAKLSKANGWDNDFFGVLKIGYTYEECEKRALEFKTKAEFRTAEPAMYEYAMKHKWLAEITSHMPKRTVSNKPS